MACTESVSHATRAERPPAGDDVPAMKELEIAAVPAGRPAQRRTTRQGTATLVATLVLTISAASCDRATTIAIDSTSSEGAIAFTLSRGSTSRPAAIAAFRVDRCNARGAPAPESHWLTLAPDSAEQVSRITYGAPPAGWRSTQGPQPLVPGCYRAAVASAPPLEFDLLPDGQVKTRR